MSRKLINLIGKTVSEIASLEVMEGEPSFRTQQIASWIYSKAVTSFDEMTTLPKDLRTRLEDTCSLGRVPVLKRQTSSDGEANKYLFDLGENHEVEAVMMRTYRRDTICVSTQAGCAFNCRFCATARLGLARDLTPYEIISQVMIMRQELLAEGGEGHFNLVFMGMGEPLANYDALIRSIDILQDKNSLAVGRRRMTISTVGLLPRINQLAQEKQAVRLALSLNATTDETRDYLMPINKTYSIYQLLPALKSYGRETGNRVTLEYVLIDGINDSREDARRLAEFACDYQCKINLIAFNPHQGTDLRPSPDETVQAFFNYLDLNAPTVSLRISKGADIQAACGQLAGGEKQSPKKGYQS